MSPTLHTWTEQTRTSPPKPKPLDQWLLLDASKLRLLDTHNKREWYSHPDRSVKDFELEAQPRLIDPNRDVVPSEPIIKVVVDEQVLYQVLKRHERGELDRRKKADAPKVLVPTDHGVTDLLDQYSSFSKGTVYHHRGCQQIENVLFDVGGLVIHLTPSRTRLFATRVGDKRAFWSVVDIFEKLEPLLLPWKRDGVEPPCEVTAHKQTVKATTVTVGRTPWCEECQP